MRVHHPMFLHKDTAHYLEVLKQQWNLKSTSEVIDVLVRKRWKGDQVRAAKKLEKRQKVA